MALGGGAPGILSTNDFESMIAYFIPDALIQDTRIPFRAVAMDLITGEQIIFSEGSLREVVVASSAVPVAIEHVREGRKLLSDGGIISMMPVNVVKKEGGDFSQAAVLVNENEKAASAMLSRVRSTRLSFKTWFNLIKTLGARRQYEKDN